MRLNLVTEGSTEEIFIRDVLAPYLGERGVCAVARNVGGGRRYARARRDIEIWLKQDNGAYVSTMFDMYALYKDFPSREQAWRITDPIGRAEFLERAFGDDINHLQFIPFVQPHEFESLLFSDVRAIAGVLEDTAILKHVDKLETARRGFATPEHINDSVETSPSHRLLDVYPTYSKVVHGTAISASITIATIRSECRHFDSWVTSLEAKAAERAAVD